MTDNEQWTEHDIQILGQRFVAAVDATEYDDSAEAVANDGDCARAFLSYMYARAKVKNIRGEDITEELEALENIRHIAHLKELKPRKLRERGYDDLREMGRRRHPAPGSRILSAITRRLVLQEVDEQGDLNISQHELAESVRDAVNTHLQKMGHVRDDSYPSVRTVQRILSSA